MCTNVTSVVEIGGSGLGTSGWFPLERAVVYFDHPQDAAVDHALCIDLRGAGLARVAVELDAPSARRLVETVLAALGSEEVRELIEDRTPSPGP